MKNCLPVDGAPTPEASGRMEGENNMTRIENIYTRAFQELPETRSEDDALTEELKEYLENVKWPVSSREEMEELVYAGSSFGQKRGFISGFRYAIALIFESLI